MSVLAFLILKQLGSSHLPAEGLGLRVLLADGHVCLPDSFLFQQATLPAVSPFRVHFFELNILKGVFLKSLLYMRILLGGEGMAEPCGPRVACGHTASLPPGGLVERQTLLSHPRTLESGCVFDKIPE